MDDNETNSNSQEPPGPDETITLNPTMPPTQESIFKTITKRITQLEQHIALAFEHLDFQRNAFEQVLDSMETMHQQRLTEAVTQLNLTTTNQMNILVLSMPSGRMHVWMGVSSMWMCGSVEKLL